MSSYKHGGLERDRYFVMKNDGGEAVSTDPSAKYFVLRLDRDPHARIAAMAYAKSVIKDNPILSRDLWMLLSDLQELMNTEGVDNL